MRTTIKNKTKLRKLIKSQMNSTVTQKYVEFYADWSWKVFEYNLKSNVCVFRILLSELSEDLHDKKFLDDAITTYFLDIEREMIE